MKKQSIRVVCIADSHENHESITKKIPKCDLLIHAGDITYTGDINKVAKFNKWCELLQERDIVQDVVVIAGNHDKSAWTVPDVWTKTLADVTYLCDSHITYKGWKIYGSPWSPSFFRQHWVFNADRGEEIRAHWDNIPSDTDILITHGPSYGILDMTPRGEAVGCQDLLEAVNRIRPAVHICGHIHYGYGQKYYNDTLCVNASVCTEAYKPDNDPIVLELTGEES